MGTILVLLFLTWIAAAQVPPGYYDPANGLVGQPLQTALHNIIKGHTVASYSSLWTHFQSTDKRANGTVWDMYSDVPGGSSPYNYQFGSDQCGNYSSEGDCYNREHSWPKSWFGDIAPMNSDIFHIYPTDGYVNGKRDNYPYGEVGTATWTSLNGCKLGPSTVTGYSGVVFEPLDAYKGDFARTYFYMSVRYYTEDGGWPGSPMTNGSQLKPWAMQMMLQWNNDDPVSQKEIDRNNYVYSQVQHNRNPFIDNPSFAEAIWGYPTALNGVEPPNHLTVFPTPAHHQCKITLPETLKGRKLLLSAISLSGKALPLQMTPEYGVLSVSIQNLDPGFYFVILRTVEDDFTYSGKLIKE
jgi:endonuclease I